MENEAEEILEEWRQVVDDFGARLEYDVSSLGRVRSQKPGREGRIMSGGEGPEGTKAKTRLVWIMDSFHDTARPYRVDKMVAKAFLGPAGTKERVIHKNGMAWDDRLENLEYGTPTVSDASIPPALRGTLTTEQAQAKVKAAKKELRDAVERLESAVTELEVAMAAEAAQTGVQSLQG